jgi:hypothetical protein
MFGKNIDRSKIEVRIRVEHFFVNAFKKFHITIWSYMKLKDVLEVPPMLMPKTFVGWFVFIWGSEQCSKTFDIISSWFLLLFKRFVVGILCLLWATLWQGRSNIID